MICYSSHITLDYLYVSQSKKCHETILIAHLFCNKFKTLQTLYFVNIDLKLEWP